MALPLPESKTAKIAKTDFFALVKEVNAIAGGRYPLDTFAGVTDDDKLTSASSFAQTQTYRPIITLSARAYNFATPRDAFPGLRIEGPPGSRNSSTAVLKQAGRVTISTAAGVAWLNFPGTGNTDNVTIKNMSFLGNGTNVFAAGGGVFHYGLLRDISFASFRHVLGTPTQTLRLSEALFNGYFETNDGTHTQYTLGGEDNTLWMDGHYLDSPPTSFPSTVTTTLPLLHFNFMANSTVGPIDVTAEGMWRAVQVNGAGYGVVPTAEMPNNGGPLTFLGSRFLGASPAAPSYGAIFRNSGGLVKLEGCFVGNAFSNPTLSNVGDLGVVHTGGGGYTLANGVSYQKASSVSADAPVFYVSATTNATQRIFNASVSAQDFAWGATKPKIRQAAAGLSVFDDSVQLV